MDDDFNKLIDEAASIDNAPKQPPPAAKTYDKKTSIADDAMLKPVKLKVDDMMSVSNDYAVFFNNDITDDGKKAITAACEELNSKKFQYRYNGDTRAKFFETLSTLTGAKTLTFLPWKKFNESAKNVIVEYPEDSAYHAAAWYHGGYKKETMPAVARKFMARDMSIIAGKECTTPIKILIVWSVDKVETADKTTRETGNISYPIKVAADIDVAIFNMANDTSLDRLKEYLSTFNK